MDRCNTAVGFRAGEVFVHVPLMVDFSAALPGRVKEKGLFLVYQHPCCYCNSLSMKDMDVQNCWTPQIPGLLLVLEIRSEWPGFPDQTNTL